MPATSRSSGLALVLALVVVSPAYAAGGGVSPEEIVEAVRGYLQQIGQDPRPRPQALQAADPGGPSIDIANLSQPERIEQALRRAAPRPGPDTRLTVVNGQARLGDFTIGSDQTVTGHLLVLHGDANIHGRLLGNLVTLDGNVFVYPGGVVQGDILALNGQVSSRGGEIGGEASELATPPPEKAAPLSPLARMGVGLAGVVGVFLTTLAIGFGLVLFARPNLEIVSDTVTHSFGRAFMTGLVGQILVLPTFGMIVVGLILSVAGILLLPFAVAVYALLVLIGIVGGYIAVAHAIGETWIRRRLARGAMLGSPNSYRYLSVGLAGLFALWFAWAVFGWVPVAGELVRAAAVLVTWVLATVGFGAALLSRAGVREHFAGRLIPPEALTDEYLWATPQFGVPAVRRPGGRPPEPPHQ
jgi:MFS family permease